MDVAVADDEAAVADVDSAWEVFACGAAVG